MVKRKKRNNNNEGISFWQSASDLMIALILLLLLSLMLLSLYIIQIKWSDYTNYNPDVNKAAETTDKNEENDNPGDADEDRAGQPSQDGEGDGDDDGGGDDGDSGEGLFPDQYDGKKSAVRVILVDAETEQTIKEKGVQFDLHAKDDSVVTLYSYYPSKKQYDTFQTTKNGSFYLPEMILMGHYYLAQVSQLEGYDIADKVEFYLDGLYDWSDPFEVEIPLYPERDIIRILMTDDATGEPVSGGLFEVIADESIITKDGSIRYRKGEVVDTIKCDAKGYGESDRLFLGKYTVKQSKIPEYYANITEEISKDLTEQKEEEDKAGKNAEPVVTEVKSERTKIHLVLTDELTGDPISGAVFDVGGTAYTTGADGSIELDKLSKNTAYEFVQESSVGDYSIADPVTVKVSANGRIKKKAVGTIEVSNRMIRCEIGVKDAILGSHISGKNLSLYKDKKLIESWQSEEDYREFTDLEAGEYVLMLDNKEYPVTVSDTAEIQYNDIRLFTVESFAVIAVILLVIAVLIIIIRWIRRRRGMNNG